MMVTTRTGERQVKYLRQIMVVSAVLAAIAATSGFALPYRAGPARAPEMQRVNWGDVTIPGKLCKVNGSIRLHNGVSATVSHSGFGYPVQAYEGMVTHGNLGRGLQVTALQVFCAIAHGTGGSQLSEGIFVFDSPSGTAHLLGTLTPTYFPKGPVHIPYIAVSHISTAGHIATIEYWYTSANPDCCPSGRAYTVWRWTGHGFVPGHTTVTA
jgi:hypothetical protein